MSLAGVSANQFLKITVVAILGIILFKLLAEKSGIEGLRSVAALV